MNESPVSVLKTVLITVKEAWAQTSSYAVQATTKIKAITDQNINHNPTDTQDFDSK